MGGGRSSLKGSIRPRGEMGLAETWEESSRLVAGFGLVARSADRRDRVANCDTAVLCSDSVSPAPAEQDSLPWHEPRENRGTRRSADGDDDVHRHGSLAHR